MTTRLNKQHNKPTPLAPSTPHHNPLTWPIFPTPHSSSPEIAQHRQGTGLREESGNNIEAPTALGLVLDAKDRVIIADQDQAKLPGEGIHGGVRGGPPGAPTHSSGQRSGQAAASLPPSIPLRRTLVQGEQDSDKDNILIAPLPLVLVSAPSAGPSLALTPTAPPRESGVRPGLHWRYHSPTFSHPFALAFLLTIGSLCYAQLSPVSKVAV